MEKTYNPKYIEKHWAKVWEESGYFAPSGKGKPYCIVIPPPNVTGTLHMGHGFQHTLMDVLTRYHRMLGCNTLWQGGTDHAGIATQMLIMQQLRNSGRDPSKLTREEFDQAALAWKEQSQHTIAKQMRRLGISIDWSRERFTLDQDYSKAVHEVFISLHKKGLIYRGKKLVNWDPVYQTAVSDLEVVYSEEDGFLWYIRYPVDNSDKYIIVATTRPETLLGDTAIAVHPEDERYQDLIGLNVRLPLTERYIPIIADEYVDREFGTGCVKITPAHDFNDYLVGQRHDLPMINIFTASATLNENTPSVYQGLDRFSAREKVVNDLTTAHFLLKTEPYKIKVPRGDRSDAILEPYLTNQWFIKAKPLAKAAIEVVENKKLKFVPENWDKTYLQWLNNIEDWCISRQLWWGHRIPAWYDEKKNVYVGNDEAEIRKKYKLPQSLKLHQDPDVLDTWFSSALWPFATLGWPKKTKELKTFYPTTVLVTAFDIIFFWVARMVMMGLNFMKDVPFHEVYITGLIRDSEGQKMSKSKGNILDPIDLVDGISLEDLLAKRTANLLQASFAKQIITDTKRDFPEGIKPYGMDALRFTFCVLASTGRDINFSINRLEGYRNFTNKIWNAARFVLMQPQDQDRKKTTLTLVDCWIYSRLQRTILEVKDAIKIYRFDLMAQALYEFIWHEYCDWYLEFAKAKMHSNKVMVDVLETILRLIHPIMPFISEEIWQSVSKITGKKGNTIMREAYPKLERKKIDNKAEAEIAWLKEMIISIRNIRGEMNIPNSQKFLLQIRNATNSDQHLVNSYKNFLVHLAGIEKVEWLKTKTIPRKAASALVGKLELYIPLEHIIDLTAERDRLAKEIVKLEKETKSIQAKLENVNFVKKAPADIVAKEQERLSENVEVISKLNHRLKSLE